MKSLLFISGLLLHCWSVAVQCEYSSNGRIHSFTSPLMHEYRLRARRAAAASDQKDPSRPGGLFSSDTSHSHLEWETRSKYVDTHTMRVGPNIYHRGIAIGSVPATRSIKKGLVREASSYTVVKNGKGFLSEQIKFLTYKDQRYYWILNQYHEYYGNFPGYQRCQNEMVDRDDNQTLGNLWYNNGESRITVLHYRCVEFDEYCCGLQCCEYSSGIGFNYNMLVFLLIALALCICCLGGLIFIVYKFFRSALACCFGDKDKDADSESVDIHEQVDLRRVSSRTSSARAQSWNQPAPYPVVSTDPRHSIAYAPDPRQQYYPSKSRPPPRHSIAYGPS